MVNKYPKNEKKHKTSLVTKDQNVLQTGDKFSRIIYDRWLILRSKDSRNPRLQAMNISVRTKFGDFLLPWANIKLMSSRFSCCYYFDFLHLASLIRLRVMFGGILLVGQ